jgi:hypothetical protein
MDAIKDGRLTLDEIRAFMTGQTGTGPAAIAAVFFGSSRS